MHPRPAPGHTPERDGVDSTQLWAGAVEPLVHGTARHSAPPDSAFLIFRIEADSRSPQKGMGRRSAGRPLLEQDKDRATNRDSRLGAVWIDGDYVVSALATHYPSVHCLKEPNRRARTSPSRSVGWVHRLEHRVSSGSASGSSYCRGTAGQRAAMNGRMRWIVT
jgi:hypothetical protein